MAKKGSHKWIKWVVILVVLAGVITSAVLMAPKAELYDDETAKSGDLSTFYNFSGNVETKNKQVVLADAATLINKVKVKEGDMVKKDEVLFTTLTGGEIKANIDGEVGIVSVEDGATLMPGTQMTTITNYNDLQIQIKVDEYDIAVMKVDKEVTIHLNALDKDVSGKIEAVSKEAVTVNNVSFFTATVKINEVEGIYAGMSAEVTMLNQFAENATTISVKALQFDNENKPYVYYRNADDKVETKSVTIGINDGTTVQITDGVKAGDVVLVPKDSGNANPFSAMRNS